MCLCMTGKQWKDPALKYVLQEQFRKNARIQLLEGRTKKKHTHTHQNSRAANLVFPVIYFLCNSQEKDNIGKNSGPNKRTFKERNEVYCQGKKKMVTF